jgi:hypothetical protein
MTDPLRSLSEIVRTLTRSRTEKRGEGTAAQQRPTSEIRGDAYPVSAKPSDIERLRDQLRQKIRTVGHADSKRAREAFVETVLSVELGEAVTLDPALAEIVGRIAIQLGEDSATDRDLRALIEDLSREAG